MLLTYLDQNALLALGYRSREQPFREKVDDVLGSGVLTVVVSPWHLIETANTSDVARAVELADFLDSLSPRWLLERRDVQKLDIEDDFCRFLGLNSPRRPRVTTRSAAHAALLGQRDGARYDISSANFVRQWIEHPDQLRALVQTYARNAETLTRLRELEKQGRLTEGIRRRAEELMVELSLPASTPNGLAVGRQLVAEYIKNARLETIPSLGIEYVISRHEWTSSGKVDRNTQIDKMHMISALTCVDEIVSDDKFFSQIYPVVEESGLVKAKLVKNKEFLERF